MDQNLLLALTLSATLQCLAQTPEPFEVRRAEAAFKELPELSGEASPRLPEELEKRGNHTAGSSCSWPAKVIIAHDTAITHGARARRAEY